MKHDVTVDALANDTDANGDLLQLAGFTQGANGQVTQLGTALVYTPNTGYAGSDQFTYVVSDGKLQTTGTVLVTVVDPNAPVLPVTTSTAKKTTSKGAVYYDVTLTASKPSTIYFEFASGGTILSTSGGTYYTGSGFQVYTGVVKIKMNKGGSGYFKYYAAGNDGTVEAVRQELLQ